MDGLIRGVSFGCLCLARAPPLRPPCWEDEGATRQSRRKRRSWNRSKSCRGRGRWNERRSRKRELERKGKKRMVNNDGKKSSLRSTVFRDDDGDEERKDVWAGGEAERKRKKKVRNGEKAKEEEGAVKVP